MGNHKDRKNAVALPPQRTCRGLQRRARDHDVVHQHHVRLRWQASHPEMRPSATKTLCSRPGSASKAGEKVADDGEPPRQSAENSEAG